MASSIVSAAGKSLGSRHNSHSNLVRDDSVNEWLTGSHDNTPKGHQPANTAYSAIPRDSSFASLTDGFDIVSPSSLSWANPPETKLPTLNHADDYLSHLAEHSIDLKSTFTETLHVDDFFNDTASASSSPYMATTINLPGWNHGPEVMGGLIDSDVDSPEGIWYGQTQAVTAKTARRGVNVPSFAISIDQADDELDSPGGLGAGLDQLSSDLSPAGSEAPGFLGAPSRTLRSCISAPLLQRDDPVLAAAGSQTLINDYLIDVGFPQERIPGDNALGLELGPRASNASSPANNVPGHPQTVLPGDESKDGMPALTELSGNASVAQSSALFQRRAVQRDLSAPSPVAVPQGGEGDQTIEVAPGRTVTIGNPAESTIDPEKMTDEQRKRLAQLHQIHVAQQAARLGVYQDFVTPSQQFAGQEASERAAKAVQAALMYGMEGNSPRKLSLGSTGLLTPVTPQHPLQPGPSGMPAYQHGVQGYVPMPMQGYAGFDPRVPGMPLSADSASFAPSIQNQFSNLHLAQQQGQPTQQGVFTPQFVHQHDATLFAGNVATGSQDLSGYTSVYPPPRHNSISASSVGDRGLHALTLNPSGMVSATGHFGSSGEQMLLPPRRASHAVLRTTESSPSLASQIAANPMQLQNPFVQQQGAATLEPAKLMAGSGSGLVPAAAATPRSAPADASREHLALQQTRMRQLQQQQLQLLQMQNQARSVNPAPKAGPSLGLATRKVPGTLTGPLSPPRSPAKMKSTPHLRSPMVGTSTLPPSPSKPLAPGLRKIASNRRITTTTTGSGGSSSSSSSSVSASGGVLRSKGSILGNTGGFTLELTTSASPTRARTISHQSASSSRSHSSPGKSKSPTPMAVGGAGFSQLAFVNYGMNDADEICSAVAPSGSYKVPLRGFGASSGEEDDFDDETSSVRTRTMSNVTGTTAMAGSDDDDFDMTSPASASGAAPGSPTKRLRKNSSRPVMATAGASPLKSKRSMANIGSSRTWDLNRSPRKAKSGVLSPVSSAGSGE